MQMRETYQSQIDIEQNELMKVFTLITTLFLPLSRYGRMVWNEFSQYAGTFFSMGVSRIYYRKYRDQLRFDSIF